METSPDKDGALNVGLSFRTGKAIEKGKYQNITTWSSLSVFISHVIPTELTLE
jgi:hypothetical protein